MLLQQDVVYNVQPDAVYNPATTCSSLWEILSVAAGTGLMGENTGHPKYDGKAPQVNLPLTAPKEPGRAPARQLN